MELEKFLTLLNLQLTRSLASMPLAKEMANLNKETPPIGLIEKIKLVSISLEKYQHAIDNLKTLYNVKERNIAPRDVESNQFILSFEESESEPFRKNAHIETFKKTLETQIIKHKYIDALKSTKISGQNSNTLGKPLLSKQLLEMPRSDESHEMPLEFQKMIKLDSIEDIPLKQNSLNLPVVDDLGKMRGAFHWYEGDKFYKKGIYICMCDGFYVKVPFPNVINGSTKEFKLNSIRCKHETLRECQMNKKKNSEIYGSDMRQCFYVHKKEKFNKIGSQYRCDTEHFGNHESLDKDLEKASNFDIKHILMYSLSDDLLAMLWYQNKFKDGKKLVFTNLDTF